MQGPFGKLFAENKRLRRMTWLSVVTMLCIAYLDTSLSMGVMNHSDKIQRLSKNFTKISKLNRPHVLVPLGPLVPAMYESK